MTAQFTHGYALIIGVDEYANTQFDLPVVGKDVNALRKMLTDPNRCGYLADNVHFLQGKNATTSAIKNELKWLRTVVDNDPEATVVFYYSGHGAVFEDKYYLVTHEVQASKDLPFDGLDAAELNALVQRIDPARFFAIFDCCHASGLKVKSLPFPADSDSKSLEGGLNNLLAGAGRIILNSCRTEQQSFIRRDEKMSIFTYELIDAFSKAGRDGLVTVHDLVGYVCNRVSSVAKEQHCTQTPTFHGEGGFPIALHLGGRGLGAGQTPPSPLDDYPVAQPQINLGDRAVYVEGDAQDINTGTINNNTVTNTTTVQGDSVAVDKRSTGGIHAPKIDAKNVVAGTQINNYYGKPEKKPSRVTELKRARLQREKDGLLEEYEAVLGQYEVTWAEDDRIRLQRKLKQIEARSSVVESELSSL